MPEAAIRSAAAVAAPLLVVAALAAGCGSAPVAAPEERAGGKRFPRDDARAPAARAVDAARSLLGTPYRYGGADRRGFDCSGLTAYALSSAGVRIPRTAEEQARSGRWVAPDELAPGDLVFFGGTRAKARHVGLVVSPPGAPLTMIHASTTAGVVETRVTGSRYWLERLLFGRRVLAQ